MSPVRPSRSRSRFGCWLQLAAASLLLTAGCTDLVPTPAETAISVQDPFAAALTDTPREQYVYIDASRPVLTAIAGRNYPALYDLLSSHARARTRPDQFVPQLDDKPQAAAPPLENLTREQFVEWMQKMEQALGVPDALQHLSVDSADPEILSGRGDRLSVMFAIGQMPPEIPADIRKASIRAALRCKLSDAAVKEIAEQLKISEDQVRSGKWPENDLYSSPEEAAPYFNLKFVLVEEQGQLKVGYFEFMPPSILD